MMPRPLRIDYPGAFHHVFNRGISKKSICFSDYHKMFFLDLIELTCEKYPIEVHAYCLMSNHYHLLIKSVEPCLSDAMRFFGSRFSIQINKDLNADGALFRSRFKSILVESERYLLQLSRYIHMNPVEAGYCELPEEYEWSSFRQFVGTEKPKLFMNLNETLRYVRNPEDYSYFVKQGIDGELRKQYEKGNCPSVLGGKDFLKKVLKK
jgi:REP element-mobilizing transposase RayT